jgi:starch synthase
MAMGGKKKHQPPPDLAAPPAETAAPIPKTKAKQPRKAKAASPPAPPAAPPSASAAPKEKAKPGQKLKARPAPAAPIKATAKAKAPAPKSKKVGPPMPAKPAGPSDPAAFSEVTTLEAVRVTGPEPAALESPIARTSSRRALRTRKTRPEHETLKIVVVASECAPFAKTGGLADAVAGLSKALHHIGHEVRVVMPLYSQIDYARHGLRLDRSACVHMGLEENWISVHTALLEKRLPVWFVDHGRFFNRGGIYDEWGKEYQDNAFRFGLLCKSAIQLCKDFEFHPDIMHLHDWAAAPTAAFLKTWDRYHSPLSSTASVLTIHNIGYQGVYHPSALPYYGLGDEYFKPDIFEDHGRMNLLKGGIHFADAITTVSPSHAREIAEPAGGKGLAPYLANRRGDLFGILNGVDYDHWHPETDAYLPAHFSASNLAGKAQCKRALQVRFGLEANPDIPLFGIVSRFAPQKGFDLLRDSLPRAMGDMRFQLAVLGSGHSHTEDFFNWLHSVFRERVGVHIGFSDELCHLIEAGSDFFLMPSLYEPCGLNQIYSMAYGTLPVVRATGGLDDTVHNYDPATGAGTGFKFWDPTGDAVYGTLRWVVETYYRHPEHIALLQQRAMQQDFCWEAAAHAYEKVYTHARTVRSRW